MSENGRFVAFETDQKLVGTDGTGTVDIYVRDTKTGKTKIASVKSGSKAGGADAYAAEISAVGRFVVFEAYSETLVPNDDNTSGDAFVRDRKTGKTKRVSVSSSGAQADDGGLQPSISPSGRYVAFTSVSDDLVSGDSNGLTDTFVHDRKTGKTKRVSVDSIGTQSNGSSERPSAADNGTVAFSSGADNLVAGDLNGTYDVFVHNLKTGETTRASVTTSGVEGDKPSTSAAISRSGKVVAFMSASTFVGGTGGTYNEIWVHFMSSGKTNLITKGLGGTPSDGGSVSYQGALSYNGRYVAFMSFATNLVAGDTNGGADMFWYDRKAGKMKLVSFTFDESDLDEGISEGSVSGDGRFVAFDTGATNILDNELDDSRTVFIRGPLH